MWGRKLPISRPLDTPKIGSFWVKFCQMNSDRYPHARTLIRPYRTAQGILCVCVVPKPPLLRDRCEHYVWDAHVYPSLKLSISLRLAKFEPYCYIFSSTKRNTVHWRIFRKAAQLEAVQQNSFFPMHAIILISPNKLIKFSTNNQYWWSKSIWVEIPYYN